MNNLLDSLLQKVLISIVTLLSIQGLKAQVIEPLPQLHKDFQIVAHLIHGNMGGLGVSSGPGIEPSAVLRVVDSLNVIFKPIDVRFTVCEFREIENFQHDTIGDDSRDELTIKYGLRKKINLFLFDSIISDEGGNVAGNADLSGISLDIEGKTGVFIENESYNISVLAHEMGHFFGLEHTFDKGAGLELVNGSNCETSGDFICDTPADPYSPGLAQEDFITNCVFTYRPRDQNGEYYSAMVNNIMSYYNGCGPQKFTHGQYVRMVEVYSANPKKW